jgi:hypothetical protein
MILNSIDCLGWWLLVQELGGFKVSLVAVELKCLVAERRSGSVFFFVAGKNFDSYPIRLGSLEVDDGS